MSNEQGQLHESQRLVDRTRLGHPSFLVLDRARLGIRSPQLDAHLAECAMCRAVVEAQPPDRVPGWVRALDEDRTTERPWWSTWAWTGPGLATAAAVAVAAFWLPATLPTESGLESSQPGSVSSDTVSVGPAPKAPYIGRKEALPAVYVYIRRDGEVFEWKNKPLRPGDRIQIYVRTDHYRYATLMTEGDGGYVRLHEQILPKSSKRIRIDRSLLVDGQPGGESLVVILSDEPVNAPGHDDRPHKGVVESWKHALRFEKELH